jgi:release factor glutamine methyltransferase
MFVQTNSVRAIKQYFRDRLSGSFSESEIRSIVKAAVQERLKLSNGDYLLADDHLLSESDLLYFRSIVKRLQQNEPFQYIIGQTEFCGLPIKCDPRVLIPRPETEELVQWIKENHSADEPLKILDLCSGSGCIALALKSIFPSSEVSGLEWSIGALDLSKENATLNALDVCFIHGDVIQSNTFTGLQTSSFDIWVSNPPYVLRSDKSAMDPNVLEHEPHMALFVEDNDPLLFYKKIAEEAKNYLKPGGEMYFEIHEHKVLEVKCLLKELDFRNIQLRKDMQGRDRMIRAFKQ